MQKIILVGNIGRDAEVKSFQSGDSILEFSLACSRKRKGATEPETTWYNISTGQTALADFLKKGKQITVIGNLTHRSYQKKDGTEGFSLDVRADTIQLHSGGERTEQPASTHQPGTASRRQSQPLPAALAGDGSADDSSDLPF